MFTNRRNEKLVKRELLSHIQEEMTKIRNSLKSLKREETVIDKRISFLKEILNPTKKRKRDISGDLTIDDEKSPKRMKLDEDVKSSGKRESNISSRNPRLDRRIKPTIVDEKQKARGKRFMKFLNIQLIHHRKQIKKKVPKREEEEDVSPKKSDSIFRKGEAGKEEEESLMKEKEELSEKIRGMEKRLEALQDFYNRYENQLRKYHLANFLRTNTDPSIYYKPRVLTKVMEKKIEKQRRDETLTLEDLEKESEKLL